MKKNYRVNYNIVNDPGNSKKLITGDLANEKLIIGDWINISEVDSEIKKAEKVCNNLNSIRVETIIDVTSNFYRL